MKNAIIIIIAALSFKAAFCQHDTANKENGKPFSLGVSLTTTLNTYNFEGLAYTRVFRAQRISNMLFSLDPSVVFSIKKHSFSLGPNIFIIPEIVDDQKHSAWGAQFNYQYLFRKPEKAFNYFAFYNLAFARTTLKSEVYWNSPEYSDIKLKFHDYKNHVNNTIGIGLQYKFLERFYVMASISAGIQLFEYHSETSCPTLPDNQELNSSEKGNYLNYGELTGSYRVGIGYNFLEF
jgi:hypothetical protein